MNRFVVTMDAENEEWTQVKPRRQASKPETPAEDENAPQTPKARTQSFGEVHEVLGKARIGRQARREQKLEWSASKARERGQRMEKREKQREAAAREREEKLNKNHDR
jgi:hypothetical protein